MNTIWNPEKQSISDQEFIKRISQMLYAGCDPGSKHLVEMLGCISQAILKDPRTRKLPQYVALGYWLRPSSILKLIEQSVILNNDENLRLAPRGIALHLPPTNVDTIFVYSWALSVIAGNVNVVRLPRSSGADTEWLVSLILGVIVEFNELNRHIFCSYDYGGDLEASLSSQCDLRMIWGGDEKIKTVSGINIRPDGLSIGFPDRKSLALIDTEGYNNANDAKREDLAGHLFNDIYWFDQMGCGSPRLIVWVGDPPGDLSNDLYTRLARTIALKKYKCETGVAINKFLLGNELLAEGIANKMRNYSNELVVVDMLDPVAGLERTHGGGFLGECVVRKLDKICPIINRKVQTLGHFGFSSNQVNQLANLISGRGGYRIVPIGRALHFDVVWDGVDLLNHMTRKILMTQVL